MSTQYCNIYPLSQKQYYYSQENCDFLLNLDSAKLVPGSVVIEGEVAVFPDKTNTDASGYYASQDIQYDAMCGFHGLFRDMTTEFQNSGVIESFMNYPRYAKMATVALNHEESIACESVNAVEGKLCNVGQVRGLLLGRSTANPYIPFSVKPLICLNKATAPLSGAATGQVRVRVRLSPDEEFLYGSGFTLGTTGYVIQNLRMRYTTVPDDGKKQTVNMEVYQTYRSVIDSNNQNVSTFIPGLCDSIHMSFISQKVEGTPQLNYLQLAVLPGKAPYMNPGVYSGLADTYTGNHYGIERLYYSVNDTDTAVVGFTLESREEIVHNALRSFKAPPVKYSSIIRHFNQEDQSDCYLAGIPFGGLIDFSRVKFSCEIQSKCTSDATSTSGAFVAYLYARCLNSIQA